MNTSSESRTAQIWPRSHDAALIERVRKLSSILPAMAQDVAVARRDAARLRKENLALKRCLLRLEEPTPPGRETSAAHRDPSNRSPCARSANGRSESNDPTPTQTAAVTSSGH
jgi:hypothetical protein